MNSDPVDLFVCNENWEIQHWLKTFCCDLHFAAFFGLIWHKCQTAFVIMNCPSSIVPGLSCVDSSLKYILSQNFQILPTCTYALCIGLRKAIFLKWQPCLLFYVPLLHTWLSLGLSCLAVIHMHCMFQDAFCNDFIVLPVLICHIYHRGQMSWDLHGPIFIFVYVFNI